MIYLVLSILASSLINVIFRTFNRFEIDNQQAIMFNYLTCVITGLLVDWKSMHWHYVEITDGWFVISVSLGALFILVFLGMAIIARKDGISVSVVASKMGVVFPVIFATLILGESLSWILVLGIVLSLASVYLTSRKHLKVDAITLTVIPLLVFFGSGTIDTVLKWIETILPDHITEVMPVIFIFCSAGFFSILVWLYRLKKKDTQLHVKHLIAGIVLGIPNYFSIYFLFMALRSDMLQTAQVFPVNNVGVVLVSTAASIILFREKLSKINIVGLILAIVSILLISQVFIG